MLSQNFFWPNLHFIQKALKKSTSTITRPIIHPKNPKYMYTHINNYAISFSKTKRTTEKSAQAINPIQINLVLPNGQALNVKVQSVQLPNGICKVPHNLNREFK